MASEPVSADVAEAIDAYERGDTTFDELRHSLIERLQPSEVAAVFRALPADAAAQLARWAAHVSRFSTPEIVLGNFASPSETATATASSQGALLGHIGTASELLATLDLDRSVSNVRIDSFGDWYRDPWGWPELEYLAGNGREHVLARILSGPAGAAIALDVPKSAARTRPGIVLDTVDRILYQACVDSVAPAIDDRLSDSVYGWRPSAETGHVQNRSQWINYYNKLRNSAHHCSAGFHTDIANFFASVSSKAVSDALTQVAPEATLEVILRLVDVTMGSAGRSGIPQRATASSIIANLLLEPIDEAAAVPGVSGARWLDDVWLFADSDAALVRAAESVQHAVRELGYSVNEHKTSFYEGQELDDKINRINFSYVDQELRTNSQQTLVLDEALSLLLEYPEAAARYEMNFVTSRIKRYHRADLAERLAESKDDFAHFADLLAPVLLKCGLWRDLVGWCAELLTSDRLPWVKTSFLRMYPRTEQWPAALTECVAEAAADTAQHSLVRVTALSRLSSRSSGAARDIYDAAEKADLDPVLRRAMAAIGIGLEVQPRRLRRLLLADARTVPFAGYLASVGYQRSAVNVRA